MRRRLWDDVQFLVWVMWMMETLRMNMRRKRRKTKFEKRGSFLDDFLFISLFSNSDRCA